MFPAEHKGFVEKRKWYKVRWIKQPPGEANHLIGKTDLLMDIQYEEYKDYVEVLSEMHVPKCNAGLPLGFGKHSEAAIDKWIEENTKPEK